MLRGASVRSRLRRIDCAARCDPLKPGRISRRTQIAHRARPERTRCLLREAKRKAYLNRMLSARLDCTQKGQIQTIRGVGFWREGRFAKPRRRVQPEGRGYAGKHNLLRVV